MDLRTFPRIMHIYMNMMYPKKLQESHWGTWWPLWEGEGLGDITHSPLNWLPYSTQYPCFLYQLPQTGTPNELSSVALQLVDTTERALLVNISNCFLKTNKQTKIQQTGQDHLGKHISRNSALQIFEILIFLFRLSPGRTLLLTTGKRENLWILQ